MKFKLLIKFLSNGKVPSHNPLPVLLHHVDVGVPRDGLGDELHDLGRLRGLPGHHQVPKDHAPLRSTSAFSVVRGYILLTFVSKFHT